MNRVYLRHIRAAGMCANGTKTFFEKNGLDWRDFIHNGIEAEKLAATGDAMALQVVKVAQNEQR